MKIKYIQLILGILFITTDTRAQNHIEFNHLTVEDGLSQSSVTCIFQDDRGFMWFGTQDGLNRYDGYNFKVFKNDPADSASLLNNFIFGIFEDTSGVMYVETQGGGLQRYNPLSDTFTRLKKNSINLSRTRFNSVAALYYDKSGTEWIGGMGAGTGLKRIDGKTGKITVFKHDPSNPSSLSSNKVYSVYRDRSGNLWVGTSDGLDKFVEKSGKFDHYKNIPQDHYSLPDNWVWPIVEGQNGYLWIGTVRGGLSRFNPGTGRFYNYHHNAGDPGSLSDDFIYSIYQDRGGVIWIGTNTGGINYFNPSTMVFQQYNHISNDQNSLDDNNVFSIMVDHAGNYWIGTKNGGLNKFSCTTKKFTPFLNNPSSSNSIASNFVLSLAAGKDGKIWIGTFSSGLDSYDPATKKFKHYVSIASDPNTLSDNRIYSVLQGRKGMIWIGTYGGGLNKLDPATGKVTRYMQNKNNLNSISSDAVWSIAEDRLGKLWLGTFGGGLNIFNPNTGKATHIKNKPGDPNSLMDDNVIRVFIDGKNNVWIGSTKGLSEYNRKTGKFRNYREKDGLPNETVVGITEDEKGNLWISTNNGLSKFNPGTAKFKNYYAKDGLQGNEFNQNAFAMDHLTGQLLFGGPDGFNVFNPESVQENTFRPPIAFTGYLRYNTDDKGGKPIIEKGIAVRDSLFLTYKDNIINLSFSALSYHNASENQYKYKLEGFNKNWIQLRTNHSVTFTNLSPGKYDLKVIGSNNDGVWNNKGASLFIEVTPPWWKTKWAYIFYFLVFVSALYFIRKYELKRREQKAKMRENELLLKATEAEKRAIEAENERKTKELEEARQLQLSMLPKVLPKLPNLEISAFMKTATEVGGDYYDFINHESGMLNIGFGDATGHGLKAGTMVTLMKGFFISSASKLELSDFMNYCTAMIKEVRLGRILMSFSLLKIKDNKLTLTSGGMPPVYYFSCDAQKVEEIIIQGMPLGAMKNSRYNAVEKDLKTGDTILLFTDGLPEQMNNREKMLDYPAVKNRFEEVASHDPEYIIKEMVKLGDDWMGEVAQADDISMVVIKVK